MRRIVLSVLMVLIFALPLFAVFGQQPTGIYAEAILEANVRTAIGTDAQVVTMIRAGHTLPCGWAVAVLSVAVAWRPIHISAYRLGISGPCDRDWRHQRCAVHRG